VGLLQAPLGCGLTPSLSHALVLVFSGVLTIWTDAVREALVALGKSSFLIPTAGCEDMFDVILFFFAPV